MAKPQHIAIICDGNRRWAKKHHLPEFEGHRYAAEKTLEMLVDHCIKLKIPYLTFWVFSTENWHRGATWVKKFFSLLRNGFEKNIDRFNQKGVKLNLIGDLTKLPADIQETLKKWRQQSKSNTKITVTIAINYGGHDEIIRAINKLPKNQVITPEIFIKHLDTAGIPDPDILIRPGTRNTRLSGFMSWQIAYTELYYTDILFPDFKPKHLDQAISWFKQQKRNFGK